MKNRQKEDPVKALRIKATRLYRECKKHGLRQVKLAELAGTYQFSVSRFLNKKQVYLPTCEKIVKALEDWHKENVKP